MGKSVALKRNILNNILLKSKVNLKKPTTATNCKPFHIFDKSMQLKIEIPVIFPDNWDAQCEMKEIFKNSIYRYKSDPSLNKLKNSTEGEKLLYFCERH